MNTLFEVAVYLHKLKSEDTKDILEVSHSEIESLIETEEKTM